MDHLFDDRVQAGRLLADRVKALSLQDPLVIALPRGGVPVAAEVACALHAPLELLLVRKIGAPWQPELAVAAVVDGSPPELVVDERTMRLTGVGLRHLEARLPLALEEIERRRIAYLGDRPPADVEGRDVVVVDDGLATGTTARAALRALRKRGVRRLVLAVPVAARESLEALRGEADDLVCLSTPARFEAVSLHYRRFEQLEDDEVVALMRRAGDVVR